MLCLNCFKSTMLQVMWNAVKHATMYNIAVLYFNRISKNIGYNKEDMKLQWKNCRQMIADEQTGVNLIV